jgi:membrane protease YdiL (CAAX protease family)
MKGAISSQRGWKVFLGSFALLIISYIVYFVRYPIWGWTVEPIFGVLILSYAVILVFALLLLKKDLKKPLSEVFRFHGARLIGVSLLFAGLFQALWYGSALVLGGKIEVTAFPTLRGYELYSYYSLVFAFAFYAVFATFGAFAEEVAYRGYVQTRISGKYGVAVGIFVSALFFSLQHIHIFQTAWIESFFQGQFVNVMLGGLFSGYLYYKTKGDIWSVFVLHATGNILSISLPIQITYAFPYAGWVSTAVTYGVLFLVLRHFRTEIKNHRGAEEEKGSTSGFFLL